MRTLIFILLLGSNISLFGQTAYLINPAKSSCNWKGSAILGSYSIEGILAPQKGKLLVDGKKLKSGEVEIDMRSLEADNKNSNKSLRGEDWFDVKKFKTASFVTNQSLPISKGTQAIPGTLQLKGISKAIDVPAKVNLSKNEITLKGKLILDRTQIGIISNSTNFFDNLGDYAVSDDIEFEFNLVFEKQNDLRSER